MAFIRHHVGSLSCFLLLIIHLSSCWSYQQILPISNRAAKFHNIQRQTPTMRNLVPFRKTANLGSSRGLHFGKHSSGTNKWRKKEPLMLTRSFFENLERKSGKDYDWIRPIPPLSRLMM
jgi:hypothetical protein